jgi:hypothetical protein
MHAGDTLLQAFEFFLDFWVSCFLGWRTPA